MPCSAKYPITNAWCWLRIRPNFGCPAKTESAWWRSRADLGEAKVTANELLQAALRLRPDRIVLGELRGAESVSFLRAINTGHPGSFSTIHANSLSGALEQLALMVMQTGIGLSRSDTIAYATSVIDVLVQLGRDDNGKRGITQIAESHTLARAGPRD